ncbi:uncharacterized protein LOC116416388 [Nasonia vitripennis]|uniref:Uncharacterized protein n=1 Tax=Nasonia vitripennis TaxID=7425 RepID=A0A7M7T7Q6_NASVI|nr:uncharacterized protein LOC116416388 [Nasonia vitripennis]
MGSGKIFVLFAVRKGTSVGHVRNKHFMTNVLRTSAEGLSRHSRSDAHNIANFDVDDAARGIRIHHEDWPFIAGNVNANLERSDFLAVNRIARLLFYSAVHGIQNTRTQQLGDAAERLLSGRLQINLRSPHILRLTVDVSVNIDSPDRKALLVDVSRIKEELICDEIKKPIVIATYAKYNVQGLSRFTCHSAFEFEKPCITYVQVYNPNAHLIKVKRMGRLISYIISGGYSQTFCRKFKKLNRLYRDARGQLADMRAFIEKLKEGVDLRVEEQWAATPFEELRAKLDSLGDLNFCTERLISQQRIVALNVEWPDYVQESVGRHLSVLEEAFQSVANDQLSLTCRQVVRFHEAETCLKVFIDPQLYENYDYGYSVKLRNCGNIKTAVICREVFVPVDLASVVDDSDGLVGVVDEEQPRYWYVQRHQRHSQRRPRPPRSTRNYGRPLPPLRRLSNLPGIRGISKFAKYYVSLGKKAAHGTKEIVQTLQILLKCFEDDLEASPVRTEEEKKLQFLFKLLGALGRRFHAVPNSDVSVPKPLLAFRENTVNAFFVNAKERGAMCRRRIDEHCAAADVLNAILQPSTMVGALTAQAAKIPSSRRNQSFVRLLKTWIKDNVEVFPLALLTKKGGHQHYMWQRVVQPGQLVSQPVIQETRVLKRMRNLKQGASYFSRCAGIVQFRRDLPLSLEQKMDVRQPQIRVEHLGHHRVPFIKDAVITIMTAYMINDLRRLAAEPPTTTDDEIAQAVRLMGPCWPGALGGFRAFPRASSALSTPRRPSRKQTSKLRYVDSWLTTATRAQGSIVKDGYLLKRYSARSWSRRAASVG